MATSVDRTVRARTAGGAVVVDVDREWRFLVGLMLARHDVEVVGEASGFSEALDVIRQERPELVVLELAVGLEGLAIFDAVRGEQPGARVIVCSALEVYRPVLLARGAAGWTRKDDCVAALAAAVASLREDS